MLRTSCLIAALTGLAASALADLPAESIGRVETLPVPPGAHWVWASDPLLRRSALLDLDGGRFLGMVSTGYLSLAGSFPRGGGEFYVPETYYSRGSRGERTDVVTVYDAARLRPVAEVTLPPKRAINVLPSGNTALSDDDRFLAVFNQTPATSLSVVDVSRRAFVGEIATPGCSLVYAAGARRFLMLCGDGAMLVLTLDEEGHEAGRSRSAPFFDPLGDPVTEKAVRWQDTWLFVSFEGFVHPVDVAGDEPRAGARWSLLSAEDRAESWRIGGGQHLAVHQATGRLYSLVHQGEVDTHKDPGTELWIYDLETHQRVQRLEMRNPGISFVTTTIDFEAGWAHAVWNWLLDHVVPNPGIQAIAVTQDDAPLLVTTSPIGGSLGVYDASSGEFLKRLPTGNAANMVLQAPWGRGTR